MSGPSLKYRLRGWRGAAVAGAAGVGVGYAMTPSGGQRQLSAREELDTIAFAGGYVRVDDDPEAIYKEPGIKGHLKRHAAKYISLPLAAPGMGIPLMIGAMVDSSRADSNMVKAMNEPTRPRTKKNMRISHRLMKGEGGSMALMPMSARDQLDMIQLGSAWTRKEGKSRSGGLNEKGRKSYERENPGSDLKAPSKKVGNSRRASFCARMSGMKKKLTSSKTANDPDSRINKSLRAWNCSARESLDSIINLSAV